MAPKKNKGQKMALTDFFADSAPVDWAAEDIPTAPQPKDPNAGPKRGEAGYLDSMPDRSSRPGFAGAPPPSARDNVPLPTAPPYTAFVGNLTFETEEADLKEFFGDLNPTSARLVKEAGTGKAKGFGYIEFPSLDNLKAALDRSGTQLQGRTIRVGVAEPPSLGRGGFGPSAAEESNQWRRSTPLPARDAPAGGPGGAPRRGPSFGAPGGGEPGVERDWGAARGAKFVPSPSATTGGGFGGPGGRTPSGPGRERDMNFSSGAADEASAWRSNKPLVEAKESPVGGRSGFHSEVSSPGLADTETTWSRGTKLKSPAATEQSTVPRADAPTEERDWSRARNPANRQNTEGDSPAAPQERKRLQLAPRASGGSGAETASPSGGSAARSSIFGGAKPIDSAAKEAEAASKIQQRDAERREAAKKAREDEDRKATDFAKERERAIKESLAKAQAELGGAPAAAAAASAPSGAQRGGRAGAGGARPGPPRQASSSDRQHPGGNRAGRTGAQSKGEDGFEVARGGGPRGGASAAPGAAAGAAAAGGAPKKDSKTKQGFSFAAAMREGLMDDSADDSSKAVDEVTAGVKDVSV